ncbi:MAG: lactate utilization protein, partial [Anaerolineae bacterium]|nr:lactate utilization protein [Anaerolineae bacterium]
MTTKGATLRQFRRDAAKAIADEGLQGAFERATKKFRDGRTELLAELPGAEELRDRLKAIRSATLAHLGDYLLEFERNAAAAGAHVHWAEGAADATRIITDIARAHGVTMAVKSKSMASEEIRLNEALAAAGVEPVETDLGEWIIQLAGE